MRRRAYFICALAASCIFAIYNIFSGYTSGQFLQQFDPVKSTSDAGRRRQSLRIAPWKLKPASLTENNLPVEKDYQYGLTDGMSNDNNTRKQIQMLLGAAEKLDTRQYYGFNPNASVAGHWKKKCFLCENGKDAKPWPSEFGAFQGTQLLADDYMVDSRQSLEHFVVKPEKKAHVILDADQSYETKVYFGFPGSAYHNGSHFLLFYTATKAPSHLGFATSSNGIEWAKQPTTACSMCKYTREGTHNDASRLPWWGTGDMCVLYDIHETDPQHRFKGTFNCATPPGWAGEMQKWMNRHLRWKTLFAINGDNPLCLATSSDGVEWVLQSPMGTGVGDTLACLSHDKAGGRYTFVLRENFETAKDHRAIRGTKICSMTEETFFATYLNVSQRDKPITKNPWKVSNQWYFDAAFGKSEQYMRQAYAFSRSRDPTGLYWGITHMLEFVVPPRNGTTNLNDKNPAIHTLFHENTKLIGGGDRVDRIVPYLSTSRDGLHFDFWTVYHGQVFDLGAPGRTALIQPANNVVTPGDGFHYIFFTANSNHHEGRWAKGKHGEIFTEKIYVQRYQEGRLIGLRTTSGQSRLRTKPFLWPEAADELGVDVVFDLNNTYDLSAINEPCATAIITSKECQATAAAMGWDWDGDRRWHDRLPGCLKNSRNNDVNFNTDGNGIGTNTSQRPVCKKASTLHSDLTVRAICQQSGALTRIWWSARISAETNISDGVASGLACPANVGIGDRKIQLDFAFQGSAKLYSFTVGSPLPGRVPPSKRIRVATEHVVGT